MDRFTGPERDAGYLCRRAAAGAETIRTVDPRLPNNYSSLIAESSAAMKDIRADDGSDASWALTALVRPGWRGGASLMPPPVPWPPVASDVASARAT